MFFCAFDLVAAGMVAVLSAFFHWTRTGDTPFPYDLREGAKGVQLAEKGIESWEKRCWVDLPELPF